MESGRSFAVLHQYAVQQEALPSGDEMLWLFSKQCFLDVATRMTKCLWPSPTRGVDGPPLKVLEMPA